MPRKKELVAANVMPDLDVFTPSLIQTWVTGDQVIEFYPIFPLQENQPISFEIPETFTQMTDPNFLLKIKAKIVNGNDTALDANAAVAPCNLFLHAMFKDVVLKLNNIVLQQANGTYPYRSYIETNFTYSEEAKKGAIGIPQMYYQETAGSFEVQPTKEREKSNTSLDKRKQKFASSQEVIMVGRLHCDILMQNKLLLPGIKFSITLLQSSNPFRIISASENAAEKVVIKEAKLQVRRVNLTSVTLLSIERALQIKPAKYPIFHAAVRTSQILVGSSQISNFVIHNGQMPRLIILTFVQSSGFQGAYVRNPFTFTLKNCARAQLEAGGKLVPSLPYLPAKSMIEPYLSSLQIVNKLYSDSSTGLTLDDFLNGGHQILAFDLTPDDAGTSFHSSPRLNAVVTLNAFWETPFDDNYTMILYLLWDNTVTVDGRKNIILDYVP